MFSKSTLVIMLKASIDRLPWVGASGTSVFQGIARLPTALLVEETGRPSQSRRLRLVGWTLETGYNHRRRAWCF